MAFLMADKRIHINYGGHSLIDLKKRLFRLNKTNGANISPIIVIHSWLKMPREYKKHPRFFL